MEKGDTDLKSFIRSELAGFRLELKKDITALRSEFKNDMVVLRSAIKSDMAALRSELKNDVAALRSELKSDMTALRADLTKQIVDSKSEILDKVLGEINSLAAAASEEFTRIYRSIGELRTDMAKRFDRMEIKWFDQERRIVVLEDKAA